MKTERLTFRLLGSVFLLSLTVLCCGFAKVRKALNQVEGPTNNATVDPTWPNNTNAYVVTTGVVQNSGTFTNSEHTAVSNAIPAAPMPDKVDEIDISKGVCLKGDKLNKSPINRNLISVKSGKDGVDFKHERLNWPFGKPPLTLPDAYIAWMENGVVYYGQFDGYRDDGKTTSGHRDFANIRISEGKAGRFRREPPIGDGVYFAIVANDSSDGRTQFKRGGTWQKK